MGRVKVSKVPVHVRVSDMIRTLRESEITGRAHSLEAYAYACGYLESILVRSLELLPPGQRELFLASLEKRFNTQRG